MARNLNSLMLLWICILVPLVSCETNAFGSFEKSTVLKCPLKPVSKIEWYDWVYSLDADTPATIYKGGEISDDTYHGGRFTMDTNTGHLTISDLNEDDVGTYFCNTSQTDKHDFNLILAEMPECQGQVKGLREDDQTNLQCDMKYSGNQAPRLEWLREDEVLGDALDQNKIGMATRTIDIKVTGEMDKNTFICRAIIGDMVEDCSLEFEVKYKVREPTMEPEAKSYAPGATVACVAKGNPMPSVTVTLPDGEIQQGQGEVKVVIPAEWEAMTKFIHCEANNEVEGLQSSQTLNYTFTVSSEEVPNEGSNTGGEDGEGSGSNKLAGIVAGLVIGAVILVIIIVAVVCVKRRQSKPPKGSKPVPTKEDGIKDETKA